MATVKMEVNGAARGVEVDDPQTPLLYILRNDLGLTGTRFGCGLAQCGACTVLVDGRAVRSCSTAVSAVQGRRVTTIEGLGSPERTQERQGTPGLGRHGLTSSRHTLLPGRRTVVPMPCLVHCCWGTKTSTMCAARSRCSRSQVASGTRSAAAAAI